jgi:CheY-like chemotaxis protein
LILMLQNLLLKWKGEFSNEMTMSYPSILWIDEENEEQLKEYKIHLEMQGYLLDLSYSASDAQMKIQSSKKYDLIILDIRIDPGSDDFWLAKYLSGDKKLGLALLEEVIALTPYIDRVFVFSHEYFISIIEQLMATGVNRKKFLQKKDVRRPSDLLRYILGVFPEMKIV